MEIQGPVANDSGAANKGCIATVLSGCTTAIAFVGLAVTTAAGTAYEMVQPGHRAQASVPDGTCELKWWRGALGGGRYRIRCDAVGDLVVKDFKLLSGPSGVPLNESVEGFGQRPWEDQRPMAGQVIEVEGGRAWTYDGTISLGAVPYMGTNATVTLTMTVDGKKLAIQAVE